MEMSIKNWHKSVNSATVFWKMQRGGKKWIEWRGRKPDNGVDRAELRQTANQNLIWQQAPN